MNEIQDTLSRIFGVQAKLYDDGSMGGHNDVIIVCVYSPNALMHDCGADGKWHLQIAPYTSHFTWDNPNAIEKYFNTSDDVVEYLTKSSENIFSDFLRAISADYTDLIYRVGKYLTSPTNENFEKLMEHKTLLTVPLYE